MTQLHPGSKSDTIILHMNNPLQHTKPANRNHILPPTAAYALVQGTFWMTFCTYQTFAAAYLQDLGFSNTELGIVLAAGNLLSVLLAGALSTCIDRDARVTAARVIPVLFVLQAATQLYLVLFAGKGALTAIAFVVLITFANSVNAMNIKLYVDLTHGGVQVDFGIARGFGSFVYVLLCTALGVLTGLFSTRLYPLAGLVLTGLQILAHVLICSRLPEGGAAHEHAEADTKQGLPMARFLAENGRYCALLAGVVLLFFAHNMIVNFMINIVGRRRDRHGIRERVHGRDGNPGYGLVRAAVREARHEADSVCHGDCVHVEGSCDCTCFQHPYAVCGTFVAGAVLCAVHGGDRALCGPYDRACGCREGAESRDFHDDRGFHFRGTVRRHVV